MFEYVYASLRRRSRALLDRVREAGRAEARAAADRLVAVGELFVLRCRDFGEQEDWAADSWEAVAAQVGAALQCSVAMARSYLRYAMAMRDRLPEVGKVFQSGDIDYRAFQTIVFHTDLITEPDVLAKVDARLAVLVSRRPSLTRGGLAAAVDRVVAMVDSRCGAPGRQGGPGPVCGCRVRPVGDGLGGGQGVGDRRPSPGSPA